MLRLQRRLGLLRWKARMAQNGHTLLLDYSVMLPEPVYRFQWNQHHIRIIFGFTFLFIIYTVPKSGTQTSASTSKIIWAENGASFQSNGALFGEHYRIMREAIKRQI